MPYTHVFMVVASIIQSSVNFKVCNLQMHLWTQQNDLIDQIHTIVYPKYPSGCSPKLFLQKHQNLYDALLQFDSNNQTQPQSSPINKIRSVGSVTQQQQEDIQRLTMQIINLLNESCTYCHRREYSQTLFELIKKFKGNLKNLAIGKMPIRLSNWQNALEIGIIPALFYEIKQQELKIIADDLYQQYHRIPYQQTLLFNYTDIIIAKTKFQNIAHSTQSNLPLTHQYYIALIAASTYGCKYLWNRSADHFLRVGGDVRWIQQGVRAAPACLQQMSVYSCQMAYNFSELFEQRIFQGDLRSSGQDNQYKLQALMMLSYYQALSCLSLIFGLIPESNHNQKYLPTAPFLKPSLQSFETVRKTEGIDTLYEAKMAEEFTNLYSWQSSQDDYRLKIRQRELSMKKSGSIDRNRKMEMLRQLQEDSVYLLGKAEEDQIYQKVKKLQYFKHIQKVFQKYVDFGPLAKNCQIKKQLPSQIDSELILSSDWDFNIKGLNRIQSSLGSKYRQATQNLIQSLRLLQHQKSKHLKAYYEFFNNYMHEYISYTKLVKDLTMTEKNYLKIITKSPFLFTQQTFVKMKQDLKKLDMDVMEFVLDSISYKMQLNVTLITYIYDKSAEDGI